MKASGPMNKPKPPMARFIDLEAAGGESIQEETKVGNMQNSIIIESKWKENQPTPPQ